jgi:hypothetical protein
MTMSGVRVVRRLFVISGLVVFCGIFMVPRGKSVMFGCVTVMFGSFF